MSRLVSDWAKFYEDVVDRFSAPEPMFLSRIGGSDTSALVDYIETRAGDLSLKRNIATHMPIVERYNGFYDLSANKEDTYVKYLEILHDCYRKTDMATLGHLHFLSIYFPQTLNEKFFAKNIPNRQQIEAFMNEIIEPDSLVGLYPYTFVEGLVRNRYSLFRTFSTILEGKNVLVISPFSQSIIANAKNVTKFFKHDYVYPSFRLSLLNSPVTYSGMPQSMYPHANWIETTEALKREVQKVDFDIALLCCGSYAMPLGVFIQEQMKRKAIYVGGVLQLYFGIMGRRYEDPFFLDQINREHFIQPVERQKFLDMLPQSDTTAREAFGAYF